MSSFSNPVEMLWVACVHSLWPAPSAAIFGSDDEESLGHGRTSPYEAGSPWLEGVRLGIEFKRIPFCLISIRFVYWLYHDPYLRGRGSSQPAPLNSGLHTEWTKLGSEENMMILGINGGKVRNAFDYLTFNFELGMLLKCFGSFCVTFPFVTLTLGAQFGSAFFSICLSQ